MAQSTFRRTKDPLGVVALLHIASGRRSLLGAIARASHNAPDNAGPKLTKLLGLTGPGVRGRRAAHRNAFALLSKCKFYTSAACFLCASPPFVREASDVILTRLK